MLDFKKYLQINDNGRTSFTIVLVLIFFIFSLFGILNHEIWRDEAQAWLIARDSFSIGALFSNLQYEGHPVLWYLCLYLITRFTHNPIFMQLFHGFISTVCTFLFVQYSPFSRLQKILFIFGYFPFFEYNVISRNYNLGLLFIFLICIYINRHKKNLLIYFLIALLFNTNAYGFIIALSFLIVLFIKVFFRKARFKIKIDLKWSYTINLLTISIGMINALYLLIPPPDAKFTSDIKQVISPALSLSSSTTYFINIEHLIKTISTLGKIYLQIPDSFIKLLPSEFINLGFLMISCLLFILIIILTRKSFALLLYLLGTCSILIFMYTKFFGYTRHHGHLFIILIACLWLATYHKEKEDKKFSISLRNTIFIHNYKKHLLTILLCLHLCSGFFAFSRDLIRPFSGSKEISNFIQEHRLNNLIIVVNPDYYGSTIAAYLDRQVYYLESQEFGSFVRWNDRRDITTQERDDAIAKLTQRYPILLILDKELTTVEMTKFQGSLIFYSSKSISSEDYYLYLMYPNSVEFNPQNSSINTSIVNSTNAING